MSSPRELELDFAAALLGASDALIAGEIVADGLEPAARIAIYRHHVFTTLTEALATTYPVVVRLVDRRFFAYAADRYIREHPPVGPCLFEYGEALADFLASFPPCRDLAYLADVARLEWAMNRALHAADAVALDPRWLGVVPPDEVGRLKLRLHPSVSLIESPWPIHRIWQANQPGADPEVTVSLDEGGVYLQVDRVDDEVMFRRITPGALAFRQALTGDGDLRSAAEAAASADPSFDLAGALAELLDEGLIVGASASSDPGRDAAAGTAGMRRPGTTTLSTDHGGPRCTPTQRPC